MAVYFLLSMLIFRGLKLVSFLSFLNIPRRDTDRRRGYLCSHPALSTWGRCFCCYVKLKAPGSVSQVAFLSGILLQNLGTGVWIRRDYSLSVLVFYKDRGEVCQIHWCWLMWWGSYLPWGQCCPTSISEWFLLRRGNWRYFPLSSDRDSIEWEIL